MLSSLLILLLLPCYNSFLLSHTKPYPYVTVAWMVRNIDLPEALVFYGLDSILDADKRNVLEGVSQLLKECKDISTPVVVLTDSPMPDSITLPILCCQSSDLLSVVESLLVQPRGFGGSSGFGRKVAEPERPPFMQHVVVLCTTVEQCRAARYVGARCVCLTDNDLADAVVSGWDQICLDDISTPGSYWLNPPYPKDDDGNRVDVYRRMAAPEEQVMSPFDIDTILADLDPL